MNVSEAEKTAMAEVERGHVAVSEAKIAERSELLAGTKKWNQNLNGKVCGVGGKVAESANSATDRPPISKICAPGTNLFVT